MSRPMEFHRPTEYDPSLAAALNHGNPTMTRSEVLKNEMGFESDSDVDSTVEGGRGDFDSDELDRLTSELSEATEARIRAEEQVTYMQARMDELQQMSKQAKNILVQKFRQQLKVLMNQVEEQKLMLTEDDDKLEQLRLVILKLESGDKASADEIQSKIKEFRDSRVLTRENTTLRYKIEELTQQNRSQKDEMSEIKAQNEAFMDKLKITDGEDIISLKQRVDKLEAERVLLREEIKKRHIERSKILAKIGKVEGSPLDEIDDAPSTTTQKTLHTDERAQYITKIKELETRLKQAGNTNGMPPASAAPAAAAANGNDSDKVATIQKLDELLKRREEECKDIKEKAKEKLLTASNAIKKLKTEYANLRSAYNKLKTEGGSSDANRSAFAANMARRKTGLSAAQKSTAAIKQSLALIKQDMMNMSTDLPSLAPSITKAVNHFIESKKNETAHLMTSYKKEMILRKQYFNQIQELKGNIRVYCRVRPFLKAEGDDDANKDVVSFPEENEMIIQNFEKKTTHNFEFEKIFSPKATQSEIFTEVSDLVLSVLDGYNVCIFAYGQTGSGKTYTMQGPKEDPGVNIRALSKLFDTAAERFPDIKYDIKVTLLEIYNDRIQDLLGDKGRVLKAVQGQYGMEVQDLTMVPVKTQKDVLDTLAKGSKNRSVTATQMNDVSSRSHLILSVYVLAHNSITNKDTMGKLHLIDLAGSERVGRSGVTGDAMKEAQCINTSLSALGNVISARANKSAHVPYRDSTLTYLLQDSLEKNSKTLMFVQVSPTRSDSSESICSLRFAERVRKVELGKATTVAKK